MKYFLFALIILIMVVVIMSFGDVDLKVIHEWKCVNFTWKCRKQMEDMKRQNKYNPKKCILHDASKADNGKIFVTIPRESSEKCLNSPATLATVASEKGPGGPLLKPYPDWSWHDSKYKCSGITNVHRVDIHCNHLFVLDNGKCGSKQICNPKLLIFDLKDDTLKKTIHIPIDIANNKAGYGLLIAPLVYVPNGCSQLLNEMNEMIVFMSDPVGFGLVVYTSLTQRLCRVECDNMKPTSTSFSIRDKNFSYKRGIFSMEIVGDDLHYIPLTGKEIYKIPIKTLLKCPNKKEANEESKLVIKLSSHSGPITSMGRAIFYSDVEAMSILGANVCTNPKNVVTLAADPKKLPVVSAMKVSHFSQKLTCLSSTHFESYAFDKLNSMSEINFRYIEMEIAEIKQKISTTCPNITDNASSLSGLINTVKNTIHNIISIIF